VQQSYTSSAGANRDEHRSFYSNPQQSHIRQDLPQQSGEWLSRHLSQQSRQNLLQNEHRKITGFEQIKSQGKGLVVQTDRLSYLDLEHIENQPTQSYIKQADNQNAVLDKFSFLDQGQKALNFNREQQKIQLCDLTKEKVVLEYSLNEHKILDFTPAAGKQSETQPTNEFNSISSQGIIQHDVRGPRVVNERFYKTKQFFEKVYAPTAGKYIVCSSNGDVRFFNKVTDNMKASNLVPSFLGESVVSVDSYENGSLLLLTMKSFLTLVPTVANGRSAFDFMFKKDCKPSLLVLRVSLQSLLQHGIREPNFSQGQFQSSADNSNITLVAVCENLVVFWQMKDIVQGRHESKDVRKMDKKLLKSEFVYKHNDLLTVFEDEVKLFKDTKDTGGNY
jgi:hypothetical protein